MVIERVVGEAVDELSGQSKRKWGLMLFMFALGAATLAVLLVRATKGAATGTDPEMETTASAGGADAPRPSEPSSSHDWSYRRAQLAHSDATMRARVGQAASHLHPRRFGRKNDAAAEIDKGAAAADQPVRAS